MKTEEEHDGKEEERGRREKRHAKEGEKEGSMWEKKESEERD